MEWNNQKTDIAVVRPPVCPACCSAKFTLNTVELNRK